VAVTVLVALAAIAFAVAGIALATSDGEWNPIAFTDVEPLPGAVRGDGVAIEDEVARRVSEWSTQFNVDTMSERELADGMMSLWEAMGSMGGDGLDR
jgi:hypothetical protein